MRWSGLFAVALQTLIVAGLARAGERRVRVVWSMPPPVDCINSAEVEAEVARRLGQVVFTNSLDAELELDARFVEEGLARSVELELTSARGEGLGKRKLHSETGACAELRALLPTVMSIMLDWPERAPASDQPKPVEPRPSPPTRPQEVRRETKVAVRLPPRRVQRRVVSLAGLVEASYALLPHTAWGGVLESSFELSPLVGFGIWTSLSLPDRTASSPAGVFQATEFGGALCLTPWGRGPLGAFGICAGGAAYRISARATDLPGSIADGRILLLSRAMGSWDAALTDSIFARVAAGLLVPYPRPRYEFYDPEGQAVLLHQPAAVAPFARIGLGLTF